jgi:hypothetical protein
MIHIMVVKPPKKLSCAHLADHIWGKDISENQVVRHSLLTHHGVKNGPFGRDCEPFKDSDSGRSDRAQWDTPLTTDPILFQSKLRLRKPKPWKPEPSVRSTEILLFITPGETSSAPGNTNNNAAGIYNKMECIIV